jgi:galactitol-specific phosphotransferase system IIB component
VPERFKRPFEQTIGQIDRLIEAAVRRLDEISASGDAEHLRITSSDYSRNIQRLMDFASGIIHGSENTMDQNEIDHLLKD